MDEKCNSQLMAVWAGYIVNVKSVKQVETEIQK